MALNRFYYPTKYKSPQEVIALGVKCVFISHQQKDKDQARKVADYLQNAGIDVYFDEYDTELKIQHQNNNPKMVTEAICKGINNSTHMLVIVSPNTINSSWVPFEIGYGFDKTELAVLCLKNIPKGSIPEYIRAAPIIRDIYDFNLKLQSISGKPEEALLKANLITEYNNRLNPLTDIMDTIINDRY